MKKFLLPTLLLVFTHNLIFSQTTGDYQSTQSGLWTDVSSWQYYNGTAWVTPSINSPQGYPGQYTVTAGAVLIQAGHNIVIGVTGISTESLGTITIKGKLTMTGTIATDVNFSFKTLNMIVTPGLTPAASIIMIEKVKMLIPVENAVLQVSAFGVNSGAVCTANQSFVVGTGDSATITNVSCAGSTNFYEVTSNGGTPNAVPTLITTPLCEGYPINLTGAYTGYGSNMVAYSWTIVDPNKNTITPAGTAQNPIINSPVPGIYKATLKCNVTFEGSYSNSEVINIKVNPTPLAPVIAAIKPIDCTSAGSVVLSGLPSGSWIINPGNKAGSGTSTTIAGLAVGSYSYNVTNQFGCTSPATAIGSIVITDKTSSTWTKVGNAAGSWSNGNPIITTNVILEGNYDTSSEVNITACSLTVKDGFTLTILDGKFVTIQNNLTVETRATLNITNQGSLVMINDIGIVTNNGTIKVNKTTTPFEKWDYTYWSSPITTTPISYTAGTTFANWRWDHAYSFNPANFLDLNNDGFDDDENDWVGAANMDVPGKGYIIMGRTWGSFPATESIVFAANETNNKLNSGVIRVPISLTPGTPMDDDWNLVGNPYPCAIDANKFINANSSNIDGTLYFWTHKANLGGGLNLGPDALNFSQSDYAIYNLSGGTGTSPTVSTSGSNNTSVNSIPLGYIASCQGFFVEAQNDNVNLIFNNDMRVGSATTTANTQFYKNAPVNDPTKAKDRLWLNLENKDGMFSQQLVGYFENATNEFDNGYDGLLNDGGNYVNFYSFINDGTYKIQGRKIFNESDEVRLGYFSAVAGSFNINIDSKEGVFKTNSNAVFLEDKLLGVIHNLKKGSYKFTTESGTFDDRFVLRYTDKTLGSESFKEAENTVLVATVNKQITINLPVETIDKVQVYDLLGRSIYQKTDINSNEFAITITVQSHQVLIVKTILQNGKTVNDKIIY